MKYPMIALLLATGVTSQIPSAMAQDASAKAQEMFAAADTNQDGVLSLEEWKAAGRRDRGFAMIDADKDGKVTPEELRAAAAKRGK
jgi:Ca2+-binding EF-hand superfamily protein